MVSMLDGILFWAAVLVLAAVGMLALSQLLVWLLCGFPTRGGSALVRSRWVTEDDLIAFIAESPNGRFGIELAYAFGRQGAQLAWCTAVQNLVRQELLAEQPCENLGDTLYVVTEAGHARLAKAGGRHAS